MPPETSGSGRSSESRVIKGVLQAEIYCPVSLDERKENDRFVM